MEIIFNGLKDSQAFLRPVISKRLDDFLSEYDVALLHTHLQIRTESILYFSSWYTGSQQLNEDFNVAKKHRFCVWNSIEVAVPGQDNQLSHCPRIKVSPLPQFFLDGFEDLCG